MRLPEKIWRLGRILLEYRLRRERLRSRPFRLWIETSSCCNLRCIMCPNREMPAAAKGIMDFDLFRKIIDEAAGFASDIYLHHRGEPLTNPALCDMIRYARKAGLRTRFHSNGGLLTPERIEQLLDAQPDMISFSVDGFTAETYARIRQGGDFETTVTGIEQLARRRRERHLTKPYLIIEKIRFNDPALNIENETTTATRRRLQEAGVDEIIEKQEYVWAGEDAPECRKMPTLNACTFPWYAMVVCWDGTVTPCPQDFHAALKMGNAREKSLSEIWNDAPYRDLRRRFRTDVQSLTICRKCDRLFRPTVAGVPLQYMATFLTDHLVGYRRWRKKLGSHERN
ncbi:MAG: radical SAM/SPASM domain-containing protein [Kiritimatiellia bacterium]|nr:radical SAM protein [Lentisphaerota bacterium]